MKRILISGGYIEGGEYHFFLQNHLGSTHIVANKAGIVQQNMYYPFGLAFDNEVNSGKQPYKFTGKELDNGLNPVKAGEVKKNIIKHLGSKSNSVFDKDICCFFYDKYNDLIDFKIISVNVEYDNKTDLFLLESKGMRKIRCVAFLDKKTTNVLGFYI